MLRIKSLDQLTQVTFSIGKSIKTLTMMPSKCAHYEVEDLEELKHMTESVTGHLNIMQENLNTLRQYFLAKLKKIEFKPDQEKKVKAHTVQIASKLFV